MPSVVHEAVAATPALENAATMVSYASCAWQVPKKANARKRGRIVTERSMRNCLMLVKMSRAKNVKERREMYLMLDQSHLHLAVNYSLMYWWLVQVCFESPIPWSWRLQLTTRRSVLQRVSPRHRAASSNPSGDLRQGCLASSKGLADRRLAYTLSVIIHSVPRAPLSRQELSWNKLKHIQRNGPLNSPLM
jgi:hypothetical protein